MSRADSVFPRAFIPAQPQVENLDEERTAELAVELQEVLSNPDGEFRNDMEVAHDMAEKFLDNEVDVMAFIFTMQREGADQEEIAEQILRGAHRRTISGFMAQVKPR